MKSIKEMQARKPVELQPHGMNKYDLGALSDDQQVKLTTFKVKKKTSIFSFSEIFFCLSFFLLLTMLKSSFLNNSTKS